MSDLFVWGTLRDPALLAAVLGREAAGEPAELAGRRVAWTAGDLSPVLVEEAGASAPGLLLAGLSETDIARLDFYEFGLYRAPLTVTTVAGPRAAEAYMVPEGDRPPGAPWSFGLWQAEEGALALEAAADFMALFPGTPPGVAAMLYPQVLDRAAARLRARALRSARGLRKGGGEVRLRDRTRPYTGFFALEDWVLDYPAFAGGRSGPVKRTAFVTGDAATVLPYDPVRDRVLVVEQFRFGAAVRGDPLPWTIEPVAGRLDGGEPPEAAVRREAREEAGLELGELIEIGRYYVAPGASTEYLFSYIGLADLPDEAAGAGGLEEEDEDIRTLVLSFDALMEMVAQGGAENGPMLISALSLARLREGLRR